MAVWIFLYGPGAFLLRWYKLFFLEFEGDSPGLSLTKRPKVITAQEF
jgi:hypothetical protein